MLAFFFVYFYGRWLIGIIQQENFCTGISVGGSGGGLQKPVLAPTHPVLPYFSSAQVGIVAPSAPQAQKKPPFSSRFPVKRHPTFKKFMENGTLPFFGVRQVIKTLFSFCCSRSRAADCKFPHGDKQQKIPIKSSFFSNAFFRIWGETGSVRSKNFPFTKKSYFPP